MFKDVFEAIHNQLSNDTTLQSYVSYFKKGRKQNYPQQGYLLMMEPSIETELNPSKTSYPKITEFQYQIDIICLMNHKKELPDLILGYTDNGTVYKGLLEFVDDVKFAIRKSIGDLIATYSTRGHSESESNESSTFALSSLNSTLAVSINGKTPTGYDNINCGTETLNGSQIATNIQTALRSLGNHSDDGYLDAIVSFDPETNRFKIESDYGPQNYVNVTAGANNDCSALLGFDNPTEMRGTSIKDFYFEPVILGSVDNVNFPVRYRAIPLIVFEEVYVGG